MDGQAVLEGREAVDGTQSVLIGTIGAAPGESFGITRYNADGSLDTAFGTGGVVNTKNPRMAARYMFSNLDASNLFREF